MPKVDVKLSYTAAATGKKGTTTISDVNPSATRTSLLQLTQGLNALTTNNYVESNRVATTNLDTEDPSPEMAKSFRGITVEDAARNATAKISFNKTTSESTKPAVFFYNEGTSSVSLLSTSPVSSGSPTIALYHATIPNSDGVLYVGLSEVADFYSEFVKLTVS